MSDKMIILTDAPLLAETEKAYNVIPARGADAIWLPKSQLQRVCIIGRRPNRMLSCACPAWLLEEEDEEDHYDEVERDYLLDD